MTLTREDAIERLKQNKAAAEYYAGQSQITAEIENALKDSEAFDMAIEALSADAESRYAEWLEDIIVKAETFEWLCEDATDEEWCEKNCNYASIQAECLRHLYEVSEGGDERRAKNE